MEKVNWKKFFSELSFYLLVGLVMFLVFTTIENAKAQFGTSNRIISSPSEIELKPNSYVELDGFLNILTQNEIRFNDSSGGEYVSLKAPTTVSSSINFILPSADGSADQFLKTDGLGNLSFDSIPPQFTATNDNRILRSDNVGADEIQESLLSIDDTGYLFGATRLAVDNIDLDGEVISNPTTGGLTILTGSAGDLILNPNSNEVRVSGRFDVETTSDASHPCPSMTEVQRDALTPISGDCVDNATSGNFERYDGSQWNEIGGGGSVPSIEIIERVETSGTTPAIYTKQAWTKVTLNNNRGDSVISSLTASVINLSAGTYSFEGFVQAIDGCTGFQSRVRNTSDGTTLVLGSSEYGSSASSSPDTKHSYFNSGKFTIASSKNYEIQYYVSAAVGNCRPGLAGSNGENEIYQNVIVRKY